VKPAPSALPGRAEGASGVRPARLKAVDTKGAIMEARNAASNAAQKPMWDPVALWAHVLDMPRQQSAAAAHVACAMFSGFEAMRRIQGKAAHDALKHYTSAAQRLERGCAPVEVLSVQVDLARFDAEAAMAYWQRLTETALQMQARVAACGCELVDSDKVLEACALFEKH
jgi:hypothetical protein